MSMINCIYCGKKNKEEAIKCQSCGCEILPLISVSELEYEAVHATAVETLEQKKVGFFDRGDKKKFLTSVKEGTCGFAKIVFEEYFVVSESRSDDSSPDRYSYANIRTVSGNPCKEGVRVLDLFLPSDSAENYLLHYKLKKNDIYMLVGGNTVSYLEDNLKDILGCIHVNTEKRDLPVAEGSIADRIGNILGIN